MGKLEYITFHMGGEQQKVHKYRKAVEIIRTHVGKESVHETRETHEHAKITPVSGLVITYRAIVHIHIATFLISTYQAMWNCYLHGFPTVALHIHSWSTCALLTPWTLCLAPLRDEILHYYTILQYIQAITSIGWCLSLCIVS